MIRDATGRPLLLALVLLIPLSVTGASTAGCASRGPGGERTCCQVCVSGQKPCGDRCIPVTETCLEPAGCARRG